MASRNSVHRTAALIAFIISVTVCATATYAQQLKPTTRPLLDILRAEHAAAVQSEKTSVVHHEPVTALQLMQLTLEHDNLVVRPVLKPTDGMIATSITDWPGAVFVSIGQPDTGIINFRHIDLQTPGIIATYTTILTAPGYLQIACDTETVLGTRQVSLIQSTAANVDAQNTEDSVRLTISRSSELPAITGENNDMTLLFSAPTFADLLAVHGPELRKHLAPALRHLEAEHVLRISDAQRAWQVLREHLTPAPHVQNDIRALLKIIDAGDFAARSSAEATLIGLGPEAAAAAAHIDATAFGPDARAALAMRF
jgi:hypothetical protein